MWEEKNVSDGYATNFLIPRKLAIAASGGAEKQIEELKAQSEAKKAREDEAVREKEAKRMEKHLALEKFRSQQRS